MDSWSPQSSLDTPSVGVSNEYSLTPVPTFLEPRERLKRLVCLNHPEVIHSFPQLFLTCARDVETMIIMTKQSVCLLHDNLYMTKALFAVL